MLFCTLLQKQCTYTLKTLSLLQSAVTYSWHSYNTDNIVTQLHKLKENITPTEVPSLEELKALLEDIIDNGEDIFIDKGYIPLTTNVAGLARKIQLEHFR